jgi:hypothetical protein
MARRNRRGDQDAPPPRPTGAQRREDWRGEDYLVRTVAGAAAVKSYRCPGCDQLVLPGRPHLVVWPDLDLDAGNRRHWHAACWAARERRAPGVQRGRATPRY